MLSLIWALVSTTAPAAGTGDHVTLVWEAPAECPSEDAVLDRVRARAGRAFDDHESTAMRFEVRRVDADAWILVVHDRGAPPRELPGRSCEELADTAALLVSIALAGEDADPPTPEVEATTIPRPPPRSDATRLDPVRARETIVVTPAPTQAPPRPRPRLDVALHAHGGVGFGFVGAPAGLVALGVGLRGRGWSVDAGAFGAPRARVPVGATSRIGADVSLWAGRGDGCGTPRFGRVELPICGVGWAGRMWAAGVGAVRSRRAATAWVALGVTAGLRFSLTPAFWLALRAGPLFVLRRPQFTLDGIGVVCCSQMVGALVEAGLEFRPTLARTAK
jgi:hypothetical protein